MGVFDEDVAEMSASENGDAVGALAPGAGDPSLADRVRAVHWTGVIMSC